MSPASPGGRGSPGTEPPLDKRGLPEAAVTAETLGEAEAGGGHPGPGPGGHAELPEVPAERGLCRGVDSGHGEAQLGRGGAESEDVWLRDGG